MCYKCDFLESNCGIFKQVWNIGLTNSTVVVD